MYNVDLPSDKILDKVLNNLETRRSYDKPAKVEVLKYPVNKVGQKYSIHQTIHIFISLPLKLIYGCVYTFDLPVMAV